MLNFLKKFFGTKPTASPCDDTSAKTAESAPVIVDGATGLSFPIEEASVETAKKPAAKKPRAPKDPAAPKKPRAKTAK